MPGDEMRASDQDREDAVRLFCQAYAVARLDLGDTCDRAAAAFSARTWGDLRRLTADLPPPSLLAVPEVSAHTRPGTEPRQRPRCRRPPRRPLVAVLLMALAWLAIAAADLMPEIAAPLAALPLALASMTALFEAARFATSQPPGSTPGSRR